MPKHYLAGHEAEAGGGLCPGPQDAWLGTPPPPPRRRSRSHPRGGVDDGVCCRPCPACCTGAASVPFSPSALTTLQTRGWTGREGRMADQDPAGWPKRGWTSRGERPGSRASNSHKRAGAALSAAEVQCRGGPAPERTEERAPAWAGVAVEVPWRGEAAAGSVLVGNEWEEAGGGDDGLFATGRFQFRTTATPEGSSCRG